MTESQDLKISWQRTLRVQIVDRSTIPTFTQRLSEVTYPKVNLQHSCNFLFVIKFIPKFLPLPACESTASHMTSISNVNWIGKGTIKNIAYPPSINQRLDSIEKWNSRRVGAAIPGHGLETVRSPTWMPSSGWGHPTPRAVEICNTLNLHLWLLPRLYKATILPETQEPAPQNPDRNH
jgi:hypothetical protein